MNPSKCFCTISLFHLTLTLSTVSEAREHGCTTASGRAASVGVEASNTNAFVPYLFFFYNIKALLYLISYNSFPYPEYLPNSRFPQTPERSYIT